MSDRSEALQRTTLQMIKRWSEGQITLKEIKGYTDQECQAIASQGYYFFLQGKVEPARVIFEGLVAIDPRNDYYYTALGVIYYRMGDAERALKQFTYAIRVSPDNPRPYVNRAEVYVGTRKYRDAAADLQKALRLCENPNDALAKKARAILQMLPRRR